MRRIVLPELLDYLPESDPFAVQSRKDLRGINFLMGNERWVRSCVRSLMERHSGECKVFELGAGSGALISSMSKWLIDFESAEFHGVDLVDKNESVAEEVVWHSGNLFEMEDELAGSAEIIISNLFLHHFEFEAMGAIFEKFSKAKFWVINEPLRTKQTLFMSHLMNPMVNSVTEYDMDLSIRAGFQLGELSRFFEKSKWDVKERVDFRGALRLVAERK